MRATFTPETTARVLSRPRLLERVKAGFVVVATSRGYGKSLLLQQRHQVLLEQGQQALLYACVPDDRRVLTFAFQLTRAIMRLTGIRLFEGAQSMYASGHLTSPVGLGRAIGQDLAEYTGTLNLLIDDVDSEEVLHCLAELAAQAGSRVTLVIAGLPPLAGDLPPGVTLLTDEDLAFTPEEVRELGLPDDRYEGWPVLTALAVRGKGHPQAYVLKLAEALARRDPELLPAALLSHWTRHTPPAVLQVLGLPADYLRRFARLGWPLHASAQGVSIPDLLRQAMLHELRDQGRLRECSEALADLVQETQPIRALELRSAAGDDIGALRLVRTQLSQWQRERDWTQIAAALERHFSQLTPSELLLLARAKDAVAHDQPQIQGALALAQHAQERGAPEPEASLLLGDILLRLGRLDHATQRFQKAVLALPPDSVERLNAVAWLALCHVDRGHPGEALMDLQGMAQVLRQADPDEVPTAFVAVAAASLHVGLVAEAAQAATQAYVAYRSNPAQLDTNLRAGLHLLRTLADLGEHSRARALHASFPAWGAHRWYAAALLGWQAHSAQREGRLGDGPGDALALALRAVQAARESGYETLEMQATVRLCLIRLQRHDYGDAHHLVLKIDQRAHSDPYLAPMLSDLKAVARACVLPGVARPAASQRPALVTPRETALLLDRVHSQGSQTALYGPGILKTWENWTPLPGTARVASSLDLGLPETSPVSAIRRHRLAIQTLGALDVQLDDRPLKLSARAVALLVLLSDGQRHTVEGVAQRLFAEASTGKTYASVTLNTLKKEIGRLMPVQEVLDLTPGVYALNAALDVRCDLNEIATCPPAQLPEVYRGPLLLNAPWMFITPQQVREQVLARLGSVPHADRLRTQLRCVDAWF
ncbi:hypothetical protein [Deinococcus aluminii]|uniref:Tetratricopeptide repeat protein n=1 Tax=Deinococcus aluminii TaxID=1656885 RepID=A0ABP9XEY5_9DEIO